MADYFKVSASFETSLFPFSKYAIN